MSDIATVRKQLKIKAGVVKRLTKEHVLYKDELVHQEQKRDKFVLDNAEEWDIKNATRMLEESKMMVNDSGNRLEKAVGELRDYINSAKGSYSLEGDEDLANAEKALQEANL